MAGLIPTELHRYSVRDVINGLAPLFQRRPRPSMVVLPGLGDGIPVRSARAGVIVGLKALSLPAGSKIGVPLYCCPVVFKAIKAAGHLPRFLDIDPETYCLSLEDLRVKQSDLDGLIAVHMFGNLCDMPKAIEMMSGRPVIEDCAQSIGSELNGRQGGSFGDIAVFSFRSGKYLSVGEGGALYSIRKDLLRRMADLTASMPAPKRTQELRHILTTYLRSKLRGRSLWGPVGSKIWATYNKTTDFIDKSPIFVERMFASDMAVAQSRLPLLDKMVEKQRKNAELYERTLKLAPDQYCQEPMGRRYNRFMFPIRFPSVEERDALGIWLKSRGIGTSKPYEEVIEGAATNYGYNGDCPRAERTLKTTLVIPNHYALRASDIDRIAHCINDGLEGRLPGR